MITEKRMQEGYFMLEQLLVVPASIFIIFGPYVNFITILLAALAAVPTAYFSYRTWKLLPITTEKSVDPNINILEINRYLDAKFWERFNKHSKIMKTQSSILIITFLLMIFMGSFIFLNEQFHFLQYKHNLDTISLYSIYVVTIISIICLS